MCGLGTTLPGPSSEPGSSCDQVAEKTAQLCKYSLCASLGSIFPEPKGPVIPVCRRKRQEDPGVYWPDSLESSMFIKRLSNNKTESN